MAVLDPTFAAAYIDNGKRHYLLGTEVRPFCLWHLMLLQVLDSPFVRVGEVTRFDLQTAVGICRLGYRESRVHRPFYPLLTKKALEKHVALFLDYVGDYLSKPEYTVVSFDAHRSPRRITPPPDIVATAYDVVHGAKVSIKEAWEMPIGEAYISQAMFLRVQGVQLDFMDDSERMFQRQLIQAGIK